MKTGVKLLVCLLVLGLILSCSKQEVENSTDELSLKSGALSKIDESDTDIKDRYIVVFRREVKNPAVEARLLNGKFPFAMGHVYENALKGFSATIPAQALNGLRNHPLVDYIEADMVLKANVQTLPTGIRRIAVDKNLTADINGVDNRVDVDVAILDSGIDKEHPDLNVVGGVRYYLGFLTDSKYDDDNGHGSHVGGIVGAKDNGEGVVGVAPGARLHAVKVLNSKGSGYLSDIIKGLDWVAARASTIEVLNMSLGGQGSSSSYQTAIRNCVNAGVVVVVAAGNESMDIYGNDGVFGTSDDCIPAAYPEAAAISALADTDGQPGGIGTASSYGTDDSFASFSNYSRSVVAGNPVSSPGRAIDLILPGVAILSCYKDMNYATMSGTSMASPYAAGLVALYIAEHGRASNAAGVYAIRQALINSGKAQNDPTYGLSQQNDPDGNKEYLGWASAGTAPVNNPPVADFTFLANGLTVTFTDNSTDDTGISSWSWGFGDGTNSSSQSPTHTYAAAGAYTVVLTVTDNGGLTSIREKVITVTQSNPVVLDLKATYVIVRSRYRVTLSWTPIDQVANVYRNGVLIASSIATGSYVDNVKTGATYSYQIKSGTLTSNVIVVP